MVTATAMAALRAMVLGDHGGSSSNDDGCVTTTAATVLVMIDLVALTISHFVTGPIVANAIARVVAIAIAFVSVQ